MREGSLRLRVGSAKHQTAALRKRSGQRRVAVARHSRRVARLGTARAPPVRGDYVSMPRASSACSNTKRIGGRESEAALHRPRAVTCSEAAGDAPAVSVHPSGAPAAQPLPLVSSRWRGDGGRLNVRLRCDCRGAATRAPYGCIAGEAWLASDAARRTWRCLQHQLQHGDHVQIKRSVDL